MKKKTDETRRIRLAVAALALTFMAAGPNYLQAAEQQASEAPAVKPTLPENEPPVRGPIFDLGEFRMNNLRPSQNVTIKLVFAVQLQLKEDVSPATAKQLDRWLHRLRAQVTTAIRSAELADYAEPGLTRIQTLIRLRVNRALPQQLVDGIYITEYTVGDL